MKVCIFMCIGSIAVVATAFSLHALAISIDYGLDMVIAWAKAIVHYAWKFSWCVILLFPQMIN